MLQPENDLTLASGFERSSKNKDLSEANSALDSGFLSGPQGIYSGELDSELSDSESVPLPSKDTLAKVRVDTNIDSGIIDDSQMISTGGVSEAGLPDWFNNLSIKDSPLINNLDGTKEKPSQQKTSIDANLWKLCYRQDNDGDTQLHLAIINEIPDIIWAIICLAPAPWLLDLKNDDAQAPIHLAALTRQSNVVRRLLVAGAKASIRDGDGNTALHLACQNGDLNTVETLLKPITSAELKEYNQSANQLPQSNASQQCSIDLEQRNFNGEYCVHIAAQRNHIQILKLLLRAGADINAREGRTGYTPLHLAVEYNNMELATFLLGCSNINTEALCYRQVTAYQVAIELEHSEMTSTLERLGCEVKTLDDSECECECSECEDFDESSDTDSNNMN